MIRFLTLVLLLAVSFSLHSPDAVADTDATWLLSASGNGHLYRLVESEVLWPDAFQGAQSASPPVGFMQGHLLTISNAAENLFVYDSFSFAHHPAWMGFTDAAVEGEWRWIDDTPGIWQDHDNFASPIQTAFTNWDGSEPNDSYSTGEDYGLNFWTENRWNDGQGFTGLQYYYVIEFSPATVPEPSTMFSCFVGASLLGISLGGRKISRRKNTD
jgi:hypothetical protein